MKSELYSQLTPQNVYVLLSAVVAVVIFLEGQILKKTDGKLPKSKLFRVFSLIDTSWLFVSIAVYYALELDPLMLALPAAYGIYSIAGWIYGTRLMRKEVSKRGVPNKVDDLIIPKKYIDFSQSFALIFFALCVFVLLPIKF